MRAMNDRLGVLGFTALLVTSPVVVAADYLTVDAALKSVFPEAETFTEFLLPLNPAQQQAIAVLAGPQPAHGRLRIWRAQHGSTLLGFVFVDEVIGRSDLITYAFGIEAGGMTRAVEILSYRESHGGEVRNRAWRQQFAHRQELSQLNFQTDIKNIAGATLSSEHVTQGVRWLVALWQTTLRPAPVT
jgi:hypothetical protein